MSGIRAGRLGALVRYQSADLLRAQRVLVPVIVFVLVAGVLLIGDHDAAPGPWPATALVLYALASWIGLAVANSEDPVQRSVTVASAGGPAVVAVGTALVALTISAALAVVVVALPGLISPSGFPVGALLGGVLTHLSAACAGTAVGLMVARPQISRIGWSFTVAALVIVLSAAQPWLPPVGSAVRALSRAPVPVGQLLVDLVVAVALLLGATALSWNVARRG